MLVYALELFMYLLLRNSLYVREQWESRRHIGAWRGLAVCLSFDGICKLIFSAPKVGWIRNSEFRCILGFTFLRNPVVYLDSKAVLWIILWFILIQKLFCGCDEDLVIFVLLGQLSRVPLCHFFYNPHFFNLQLPALDRSAHAESRSYSHFKCPSLHVGGTALPLLAVNSGRPVWPMKYNPTNHD